MNILETNQLTRRFGDFTAVDHLTLAIQSGEVFGLLGPNGAGKTTTLKMLTTLLAPTSGTARVAGSDIIRQPDAVRRRIGYVPQLISSDGALTGYENLLIFAKLYDVPRAEREQRIRQSLEFLGLAEVGHQLVRTYSGGMIRRLEIAQSMLHQPELLFLDEPTVGLDPNARRAVWAHIEELRQRDHMTLLITTHLMEEAEVLCGRVGIMHLGQLVACGSPSELKRSAAMEDAMLEDVFRYFTGGSLGQGSSYRETTRTRRTARRLG